MTIEEIIGIADSAYPDGLVGAVANGCEVGDTLAEFIFRELRDTYDAEATDADQLDQAARAMGTARRELEAAESAFRSRT